MLSLDYKFFLVATCMMAASATFVMIRRESDFSFGKIIIFFITFWGIQLIIQILFILFIESIEKIKKFLKRIIYFFHKQDKEFYNKLIEEKWEKKQNNTNTIIENNSAEENLFSQKLYLVVNLKTGEKRFSAEGPNLLKDTCRTRELWLRRIPAGTFMMGSQEDELGRHFDETPHVVTLTEDFYIGVFEVTCTQYELVDIGGNGTGMHPEDCLTYDAIRGHSKGKGWPSDGHLVDDESFLGKLRLKTGLIFDLPTEAQWEYACRAGTTTALNSGKNLIDVKECSNMKAVGRYLYNQSDGKGGSTSSINCSLVGSYLPNAWGLYDMHGNVKEWCLDWYGNYRTGTVTNPAGAMQGADRVLRGGCCDDEAQFCRSASRDAHYPDSDEYLLNIPEWSNIGFRIVFLPLATIRDWEEKQQEEKTFWALLVIFLLVVGVVAYVIIYEKM